MKKLIIMLMIVFGFAGPAIAKKAKVMVPAPIVSSVPTALPENILVLELSTGGAVRIQLRPDKAPGHIDRIKTLARAGFYDNVVFHRVIDGFMAQTGDPEGTGLGGSPLPDLKAEFNDTPHMRGVASMARTDAVNTANSQFFICFMPTMKLDNKYTAFGRVISGMNFVDAIERGEPPVSPSKIVKAWIEGDGPDAPRVPLTIPTAAVAMPVPLDTPLPPSAPPPPDLPVPTPRS